MSAVIRELIEEAQILYGFDIKPCAKFKTLEASITRYINNGRTYVCLWFNDNNNSTRLLKRDITNAN